MLSTFNHRQSRRPLIAVVDDDHSTGLSLVRLLKQMGFFAHYYPHGAEFLFSLGKNVPDCLLIDALMPDQDGLQIIDCIQHLKVHLPTILVTGTHDEEIQQRAYTLGVRTILSKPYSMEELSDTLNEVIGCPGYVPNRCPWPCPAISKATWNCAFSGYAHNMLMQSPPAAPTFARVPPARISLFSPASSEASAAPRVHHLPAHFS